VIFNVWDIPHLALESHQRDGWFFELPLMFLHCWFGNSKGRKFFIGVPAHPGVTLEEDQLNSAETGM